MSTVTLRVYDISDGLAKQMSQPFLGRQIDGIWHSALLVYGKEYHYGARITVDKPAEVYDLGTTEITQRMFDSFVETQLSKYTYHFVNHNCNHFTNECAKYLVGKEIPYHVSGLEEEVLATPYGQKLRPMIEKCFTQGEKLDLTNPLFGAVMDLYVESDEDQQNFHSSMFGFYPN